MRAPGFLAVLLVAVFCFGQVSPEEAQQKLKEKQSQRATERAKIVQISRGELEDMQAEISRLRATVSELEKKLQSASATAAAAKSKKTYAALEVGMTKDDVLDFVHRNSRTYKVTSITSAAPVGHATRETTVKYQGAAAGSTGRQTSDGQFAADGGGAAAKEQVAASEKVDVKITGSKTETIVLTAFKPVQVQAGGHNDVFGGYHTDYQTNYVAAGHIRIVLVDDVVSEIEAR